MVIGNNTPLTKQETKSKDVFRLTCEYLREDDEFKEKNEMICNGGSKKNTIS